MTRASAVSRLTTVLSALSAALLICRAATAAIPASNPLVKAVRQGDCQAAVRLVNPDATQNDAVTSLIAGRMLDEGLCVRQNAEAARRYYAHAADLGDAAGEREYAAKIGIGTGDAPNYEQAGMLCRQAGLDVTASIPTYELGYACTVATVAAGLLRQSLPKGAFHPNSGALIVEFTPGEAVRVESTPRVGLSEEHVGSNLRTPLIDAKAEVLKAWREAQAQVPAADPVKLGHGPVALPLDVDMVLEVGRTATTQPSTTLGGGFLGGDVLRGLAP